MKKIISILMIVVIIASVTSLSVSADPGQILFVDRFDGDSFIDANWIHEVGKFYIEDGMAKSDKAAPVLQSNFMSGGKAWSNCSVSVDLAFYDYDSSDNEGDVGLWWKDYQLLPGNVMPDDITDLDSGVVYKLELYAGLRQVRLSYRDEHMTDEDETETTNEGVTTIETTNRFGHEDDIVMYYDLPDDYEIKLDYFKPSIHNLGMRIEPDGISAYLDGKFLFKYNSPTKLGAVRPSPICLLNEGDMMVGFDNFTVATVDYPLFAADLEPDPKPEVTDKPVVNPTPGNENAPVVTQKVIVTDIETNEDGETIVVTREEIIEVPADTNPGGTVGGTGAATGDMMFVVIAVMIVSIGLAIAVKKVHE